MNALDIKPKFFYNSIRISAAEVFQFFKKELNFELNEDQIESIGWEIENNIERYFTPEDILKELSKKFLKEEIKDEIQY